jgi:hypothetical protein
VVFERRRDSIHIGDRVEFGGRPAKIVFVIDRDEWPDDEGLESRKWWHSEHGSGFLLVQNTGARIFEPDADEDLIFVSRSQAVA